ncbi:uncharacterized protein DUF934 [Hasllibacter halocynthiae]|uniref:Uncharacterized protein DUF934 n=1 Tax=Hasllibacter halocynthiae TaxID=595589 RepID=A0A2T0X8L8_9RHOB|nr:DUF934 domain-containing protein [Hasllibacter halocynthiae]PRY95288.1 uncharacterized protein DUF934 [Hasllibacter halocynthiae]
MSVIVTDGGFGPDDFEGCRAAWDALPANAGGCAVDLPSDCDPSALPGIVAAAPVMVRIAFPSFADGRGFTLARLLRAFGYDGRLRAAGHVIADQYAMARRAGFDEVEIDDLLAARQPEAQWLARADWRAHDHQARLRA